MKTCRTILHYFKIIIALVFHPALALVPLNRGLHITFDVSTTGVTFNMILNAYFFSIFLFSRLCEFSYSQIDRDRYREIYL